MDAHDRAVTAWLRQRERRTLAAVLEFAGSAPADQDAMHAGVSAITALVLGSQFKWGTGVVLDLGPEEERRFRRTILREIGVNSPGTTARKRADGRRSRRGELRQEILGVIRALFQNGKATVPRVRVDQPVLYRAGGYGRTERSRRIDFRWSVEGEKDRTKWRTVFWLAFANLLQRHGSDVIQCKNPRCANVFLRIPTTGRPRLYCEDACKDQHSYFANQSERVAYARQRRRATSMALRPHQRHAQARANGRTRD